MNPVKMNALVFLSSVAISTPVEAGQAVQAQTDHVAQQLDTAQREYQRVIEGTERDLKTVNDVERAYRVAQLQTREADHINSTLAPIKQRFPGFGRNLNIGDHCRVLRRIENYRGYISSHLIDQLKTSAFIAKLTVIYHRLSRDFHIQKFKGEDFDINNIQEAFQQELTADPIPNAATEQRGWEFTMEPLDLPPDECE